METEKDRVIDPVCGMSVGRQSGFTFTYNGSDYHFCTEKCKNLFEQEPELFLSLQKQRHGTIQSLKRETLRMITDRMSDEIRNPLTSIGGFSRRILRNLPEDSPDRRFMERVVEDVERLERIINRLVTVQPGEIQPEPAEADEIITEALMVLDEVIRSRDITVKLELRNTLAVLLDREKMKMVFLNLIKNSIESMTEGGLIEISSHTEGDELVISISDTGRGIPSDKIKHIFRPLVTSKASGPGLGLAFVKETIEAHGGTIEVESAEGKGTTFILKIPQKADTDERGVR